VVVGGAITVAPAAATRRVPDRAEAEEIARACAPYFLGPSAEEIGSTSRVLLATGMNYRYPAIPGIAERWGRSTFHCPFCHGWEVRDRKLGVLDVGGTTATLRSLLLRVWSDDVTLFTSGAAPLEPADAERLRTAGVRVEERVVAELRGPGTALTSVAFADRTERPCDALLVSVTLHQLSDLATQLGAATAPPGPSVQDPVAVDATMRTSVPGLSAAGDVSAQMPSVANAVAAGSTAAAMIVHDLVAETHGLPT
jgi:thioredoxin reductase